MIPATTVAPTAWVVGKTRDDTGRIARLIVECPHCGHDHGHDGLTGGPNYGHQDAPCRGMGGIDPTRDQGYIVRERTSCVPPMPHPNTRKANKR